jgi:hypothetical protein
MRAHRELLRDPLAYAESIGKQDRHHTIDALADEGQDTIMRLAIAPYATVPMRTFSYIACARHIQRTYMPNAQLQIVLPCNTLKTVNKTPHHLIQRTTDFLERELFFVPPPASTIKKDTVIVKDREEPPFIHINRLLFTIRGVKGEERLKEQAARRDASHADYVAGHIALHDVVDSVELYDSKKSATLSSAQRIISIGAQTERPFYNARMAARHRGDLGRWGTDMCEATGQIFTRHTLPPYLPRRQPKDGTLLFDPIGVDLDAFKEPIMQDDHARRYDPVARDIAHLYDYMRMAYDSYSETALAN